MGTDLVTSNAAPASTLDPTKWMTYSEISALTDRGTMLPFNAIEAARVFEPVRVRELLLQHDAALMPTEKRLLADRLRALWNSTTAPAQMKARDWLAETGRLLCDLPFAVVDQAIDRAVLASERGFTPTVAAIRAHADPMMADLRRNAARLRATKEVQDRPADVPTTDHPHAPGPNDQRTTAQILADAWPTMGQHEAGGRELRGGYDPDRICRAPTRADYLRMGMAADVLDRLEAPPADDQREAA